jgi:hypothetical protein
VQADNRVERVGTRQVEAAGVSMAGVWMAEGAAAAPGVRGVAVVRHHLDQAAAKDQVVLMAGSYSLVSRFRRL